MEDFAKAIVGQMDAARAEVEKELTKTSKIRFIKRYRLKKLTRLYDDLRGQTNDFAEMLDQLFGIKDEPKNPVS